VVLVTEGEVLAFSQDLEDPTPLLAVTFLRAREGAVSVRVTRI
jgi:hypothetical protein